jgi:hypothetical protein
MTAAAVAVARGTMMDRRSVARVLLVVALALVIWPGPAPVWAAPASATGLIIPGDAPDLFLLYTGDVIGYLDPCG